MRFLLPKVTACPQYRVAEETVTRGRGVSGRQSVLGKGLRKGFGLGSGRQPVDLPGPHIGAADGTVSSHPPPHFSSPRHSPGVTRPLCDPGIAPLSRPAPS